LRAYATHASISGPTDLRHHVILKATNTRGVKGLLPGSFLKDIDIGVKRLLDRVNLHEELIVDGLLEHGLVLSIEIVVAVILNRVMEAGVVVPELSRVTASEDRLLTFDNCLL